MKTVEELNIIFVIVMIKMKEIASPALQIDEFTKFLPSAFLMVWFMKMLRIWLIYSMDS